MKTRVALVEGIGESLSLVEADLAEPGTGST